MIQCPGLGVGDGVDVRFIRAFRPRNEIMNLPVAKNSVKIFSDAACFVSMSPRLQVLSTNDMSISDCKSRN